MSAETDFRALLAAHAPLTTLVGTAIAHNAVPQGTPAPYVVFTADYDPVLDMAGVRHATACTFTVQCWARSSAVAQAVADAVEGALALAPVARGVAVRSRASGYDEEADMDATVLSVEWWA